MDGVTILAVSQIMTDLNIALFVVGLTVAITLLVTIPVTFVADERGLSIALFFLMIICALAAYHGWTAPRETVVKAVLSQDVSWRELAERYEVLSVDGQILKMRKRQNETD